VNHFLAVAVLACVVGLLFMLPLLPALWELRRKSDALPLSVVQQNAGEIRHFANSFRDYIKGLEPIMQGCVAAGTSATGTLPDGEEYVVLGRLDEPLVRALAQRNATHPVVIAAGADLIVPPHATFSRDIYAGAKFQGGEQNNYRAILGEKDVQLGVSSRVMRWVHAIGEFRADVGCSLFGRVSSDSLIRLHANCSFQRLNAPRIEVGHAIDCETGLSDSGFPSNAGVLPRFLHDGDFEVRAGQIISSNMVIRGRLLLRSGARICGSVKSLDDMVLADGVSVEGSLIGARKLSIGPHCTIHGPVIAERELSIATGTRCGTWEHPTTVSAPSIEVEEGVLVFGTLWARERGQVVASP
jgi:predicted acyltransferase (DUF342 family)